MGTSARTARNLLAACAGFALLLFVTRHVARGHLITHTDEMCHTGAIAVEVLANGVRFPLLAYAPVEYNNGSFFTGLLVAAGFTILGRSVLVLKLGPHLMAAAGAAACLWLLYGCLRELGLTARRVWWLATAALAIAIALAPVVVTAESMATIGFASPAEGPQINAMLLALFASRLHMRSIASTAAFWALVGFCLYLNKGTVLVIPALAAAEYALAGAARGRLLAAAAGFLVGELPDLLAIAQRGNIGWPAIAATAQRSVSNFPYGFASSVAALADERIELIALWGLALVVGSALLAARAWRLRSDWQAIVARQAAARGAGGVPLALALVVAVTWLHVAALSIMARGGVDSYAVYGYPTMTVLVALLVARAYAALANYAGERAADAGGVAMLGLLLVMHRPDALHSGLGTLAELWRNEAGAACSWHMAEAFEREHVYGLAPPGMTREQHTIARCRSLSDPDQVLGCIGGIARTMHTRRGDRIDGGALAELSDRERLALAYYYGVHQAGSEEFCDHFNDPVLAAQCRAAVRLKCLVFADINTHFLTGRSMAAPQCELDAPPVAGYWSAARETLQARRGGIAPYVERWIGGNEVHACMAVFAACYPEHRRSGQRGPIYSNNRI